MAMEIRFIFLFLPFLVVVKEINNTENNPALKEPKAPTTEFNTLGIVFKLESTFDFWLYFFLLKQGL